jgi:hypothetical protein
LTSSLASFFFPPFFFPFFFFPMRYSREKNGTILETTSLLSPKVPSYSRRS